MTLLWVTLSNSIMAVCTPRQQQSPAASPSMQCDSAVIFDAFLFSRRIGYRNQICIRSAGCGIVEHSKWTLFKVRTWITVQLSYSDVLGGTVNYLFLRRSTHEHHCRQPRWRWRYRVQVLFAWYTSLSSNPPKLKPLRTQTSGFYFFSNVIVALHAAFPIHLPAATRADQITHHSFIVDAGCHNNTFQEYCYYDGQCCVGTCAVKFLRKRACLLQARDWMKAQNRCSHLTGVHVQCYWDDRDNDMIPTKSL